MSESCNARSSAALEHALELALPILQRAARHLDCEDCWYSCATLTCNDARRSDTCDCGAAEAIVALRQAEAALV